MVVRFNKKGDVRIRVISVYTNSQKAPDQNNPKAAFTQTKKLGKKHETRYFLKSHLYKNVAIHPLCSRKSI